MFIKSLIATFGFVIIFISSTVFADNTKDCNDQQQTNCAQRFCMMHSGMKSCVIDMDKKEGVCTCNDGATHSKS